jgi:hypothetical protein
MAVYINKEKNTTRVTEDIDPTINPLEWDLLYTNEQECEVLEKWQQEEMERYYKEENEKYMAELKRDAELWRQHRFNEDYY